MPEAAPHRVDAATHRALATQLFNQTWQLLDTPARSPEQDEQMLHAAHASRFHWGLVGDLSNLVIGEWQVSRVYSELGRGEPALHHARTAEQLSRSDEIAPWLQASVYEGVARALLASGDVAAARKSLAAAIQKLEGVDAEHRQIVQQDLRSLSATLDT